VQDSLTAYYTRKEYLDSVDAVFNKITPLKVLYFGIEHRNREKKTQWYLSSLVDLYEPVAIGGMRIGPGFDFFKKWENQQWVDMSGDLTIGFNNWDVRGRFRGYHQYAPKLFGMYQIFGAHEVDQINSYTAALQQGKRSNWYMNDQLGFYHRISPINGFFIHNSFRFERRSSIDDLEFATWLDKYWGNDQPISFDAYNAFRTTLQFTFIPFQKYVTEPHRKIVLGSKWPTFNLYWERGWNGAFGSVVDFDYVSFSVEQEIQIGTLGESKYVLRGGQFVNKDSVFYIDRKFFRQSDQDWFFRLFMSNPLYSFQNLDSSYETQSWYLEFHHIHHFNGALLNKIPFFKRTGIKELMGGGFIFLPEHNNYFYLEAFMGLERTFKFARQRLRVGAYVVFLSCQQSICFT
jgi:hypothetical protein